MSKYIIWRKNDDYKISSNDISFSTNGIWINDCLETNDNSETTFIPYNNINQIIKYNDENTLKKRK